MADSNAAALRPGTGRAYQPLTRFLSDHLTFAELEAIWRAWAPEGGAPLKDPPRAGDAHARERWVDELVERLRRAGLLGRANLRRLEELRPDLAEPLWRVAREIGLDYLSPAAESVTRGELVEPRQRFSWPLFVPRTIHEQEARGALYRRLSQGAREGQAAVVALVGAVGTGKTRLLSEYALMFRERYDMMALVEGLALRVGPGDLQADSAAQDERRHIGRQLINLVQSWWPTPDLDRAHTEGVDADAVSLAISEIARRLTLAGSRCLLVIDDVLDYHAARACVPQAPDLHVVIVCSSSALEHDQIRLDPLTPAAEMSLLLGGDPAVRTSSATRRDLVAIASELGHNALALTFASHLLRFCRPPILREWLTRVPPAERTRAFDERLDEPALKHLVRCITALRTWIGLASSSDQEQNTWTMARAMACIAPDEPVEREVLLDLMSEIARQDSGELGPARRNVPPILLNHLGPPMRNLERLGLIWVDDGRPCIASVAQAAIRGAVAQGLDVADQGPEGLAAEARVETITEGNGAADLRAAGRALARIAEERLPDELEVQVADELDALAPLLVHMVACARALVRDATASRGPALAVDELAFIWRVARYMRLRDEAPEAALLVRPLLLSAACAFDDDSSPASLLALARLHAIHMSADLLTRQGESGQPSAGRERRLLETLRRALRRVPTDPSAAQLASAGAELELQIGRAELANGRLADAERRFREVSALSSVQPWFRADAQGLLGETLRRDVESRWASAEARKAYRTELGPVAQLAEAAFRTSAQLYEEVGRERPQLLKRANRAAHLLLHARLIREQSWREVDVGIIGVDALPARLAPALERLDLASEIYQRTYSSLHVNRIKLLNERVACLLSMGRPGDAEREGLAAFRGAVARLGELWTEFTAVDSDVPPVLPTGGGSRVLLQEAAISGQRLGCAMVLRVIRALETSGSGVLSGEAGEREDVLPALNNAVSLLTAVSVCAGRLCAVGSWRASVMALFDADLAFAAGVLEYRVELQKPSVTSAALSTLTASLRHVYDIVSSSLGPHDLRSIQRARWAADAARVLESGRSIRPD